jgi:hypothetical protein
MKRKAGLDPALGSHALRSPSGIKTRTDVRLRQSHAAGPPMVGRDRDRSSSHDQHQDGKDQGCSGSSQSW